MNKMYAYKDFEKLGITDEQLERYYKPHFKLSFIKTIQISRYQMVWMFIKLKCNPMSSYGHVYIVNDWNLADNMKKVLSLPPNYKYFTLKHMYHYVDHQLNNASVIEISCHKLTDKNGLVDYFNMDYKPDPMPVMT